MSSSYQPTRQTYPRPILSIFDLLDRVLDKGMGIDANISIALVGIEILVVRARIIVAGIDTFLRYAAALGLAVVPAYQMKQQEQNKG